MHPRLRSGVPVAIDANDPSRDKLGLLLGNAVLREFDQEPRRTRDAQEAA
jgi:hypothetical protein